MKPKDIKMTGMEVIIIQVEVPLQIFQWVPTFIFWT